MSKQEKKQDKGYYKAFSGKKPQEGKCLICNILLYGTRVPMTTSIVTKIVSCKENEYVIETQNDIYSVTVFD